VLKELPAKGGFGDNHANIDNSKGRARSPSAPWNSTDGLAVRLYHRDRDSHILVFFFRDARGSALSR
jgi:hypothetical protein